MNNQSPTLDRIARGDLCAGCGLCENLVSPGKITMGLDATGYLRPRLKASLTAEEDQKVARLCPGLRLTQTNGEGIPDPIWGPIVATRVGYAADAKLRDHSSSGGALSAILIHLLDSGAVDRIVHTAADSDRPIANRTVESISQEDVYRAAGSRYAPSAPLAGLRSQLQQAGRFAFVGKPCDVAALRAYAREDPGINDKIPYMLSFFCAGVPSLTGARAILACLDIKEEDVASFRYRGEGWPGSVTITTHDGRTLRMSYADSWGAILSHHVQFRCKICPDGSGGFADLACADAWYGDNRGYPRFTEAPGRSLILSRTKKGENLLRQALAAGVLVCNDLNVREIASMQPGQRSRKKLVLSRLAAMAVTGKPVPRFRGLNLIDAAKQSSCLETVHSFVGLVRRLLFSKSVRTNRATLSEYLSTARPHD